MVTKEHCWFEAKMLAKLTVDRLRLSSGALKRLLAVTFLTMFLQVLKTQLAAKEQGFDDVVYLDAVSDTYLEEVSSCNIFVVNGNTIKTPPLQVGHCL